MTRERESKPVTGLSRQRGQDIEVGDVLPTELVTPSRVQLFRFSAVTWNPHRIHYDVPFAQAEGHPDVLVQSHLHASLLSRYVLGWAGTDARLRRFGWRNCAVAIPERQLTLGGSVTELTVDECVVDLSITDDDRTCVTAQAVLILPLSSHR